MNLATELYCNQLPGWPNEGRHILAHHDDTTIVVYQAYRPSIGKYAIEHQQLGGPEFSMSRMSWIKPNFLWIVIDLTDFVAKQRSRLTDPSFASLEMPVERVYLPRSAAAAERVHLQTRPGQAAHQR